MKTINRLHSATRWPADPLARIQLAVTDIAWVGAMYRIGMPDPDGVLMQLAISANIIRAETLNLLSEDYGPGY